MKLFLLSAGAAALALFASAPAYAEPTALEAAQEAVRSERLSEAARLLTAWLEAHPEDREARFLLARVLTWQGRANLALPEYERLLAAEPRNADFLSGEARALLGAGRSEDALASLEKARQAAPGDEAVWRLQLKTLRQLGGERAREAERLQREAELRFPGSSWGIPSAAASRRPLAVEAGGQYEFLTNGFAPWRSAYLEASQQFAERQTLYGTGRLTERFGLQDQELALGYYHPLGEKLTALVDGSFSPTHQVLAHWSLGAQALYSLPGGWGVGLGGRRTQFSSAANTRETLMLERYWENLRFAYTFSLSQIPAAPMPMGHQLAVNWYYGERSTIGLSAAVGQEMEMVGPSRLLTTDVRALALVGRHWLTPDWAAAYEASWVEQGTVYTRSGVRLGVQRLF